MEKRKGDFLHSFLAEILPMWLTLQKLPVFPSCFFAIGCMSWSKMFLLPFKPPAMGSCEHGWTSVV